MDLIINIQRSRTPSVFEICLIPLQSVLNTDSDESRHTLCVHLLNVVFVFHCILPDRCRAEVNAQMHDHCRSTCRLIHPMFFSVFFHWMRPSNVYCWRSSCLDLGTTRVIIPQLISDPVSNTHQISIWSPPTLLHHKFTSDRVSQTHQMPRVVK